MSKLKHTNGPWFYTKNESEYIEIRQNDNESWDCDYNPQIGTVHTNIYTKPSMNYESMEANARLISCAPEMLELLVEYIKSDFINGVDFLTMQNQDIIERATGMKIEEVLKCYEQQ